MMVTNTIPQKKQSNKFRKMIEEGASIIDLKPIFKSSGSEEISEKEEWNKLKDVLIQLEK